jgi:hypothetical protein
MLSGTQCVCLSDPEEPPMGGSRANASFQEETRSRHREHLFRRIAWRLQALAEGDLSERARGRAILVEVLAKGFQYENRQYSSLSAIAVAITGTRWNGLAFFGLTRPAGRKGKERLRAQG